MMEFDRTVSGGIGAVGGTGSTAGTTAADCSHRYLWDQAVDQVLADEQVTSLSATGTVVLPLTDNWERSVIGGLQCGH